MLFAKSEKLKAGLLPYCFDKQGTIYYLLMLPSDKEFGGDKFQLCKGGIKKGENAQAAALREGEEELGVKKENLKLIKKLGNFIAKKKKSNNILRVYFSFYEKPFELNPHDYEVEKVKWLTLAGFKQRGRKVQLPVIEKAEKIINDLKKDIPPST